MYLVLAEDLGAGIGHHGQVEVSLVQLLPVGAQPSQQVLPVGGVRMLEVNMLVQATREQRPPITTANHDEKPDR